MTRVTRTLQAWGSVAQALSQARAAESVTGWAGSRPRPADGEHQAYGQRFDGEPLRPAEPLAARDIDQHHGEGRRGRGVAARESEGRPARAGAAHQELDDMLDQRGADQNRTPEPPVAPRYRRQEEQQESPRDEHLRPAPIVHPARELVHETGVAHQQLTAEEDVARQDTGRVDREAEAQEDAQ